MIGKSRKAHFIATSQQFIPLLYLTIVVAIIGILAAIAIPLYANVQARARIAKAQADSRTLASAVSMYTAHMGVLPTRSEERRVGEAGSPQRAAGPFMEMIPTPAGTG